MERVQFEQEQMLAELKDLGEKGLFSPTEIKHIIKKRTAFETTLVRRIPNKNDYLRYAAYEMGLEALRRKRAARLKLPKSPPSISDYALTRRQFQIFERALKKFKSDVSLWMQYLRVAQRAGSRALAGRIAARAVQLHPRTPALYVLAAAHELAHGGMGAARVLLQRGLRLNAGSADMWREYVRLELGFVEAVRRRWDVLGISLDAAPSSAEGQGEEEDQGQDKGPGERVDRAEEEAMGDAARRTIMEGAIVRKAIDGAAKALPTIELFQNLQTLLAGYPAPKPLRSSLLDHLHARLAEALPLDAAAVALHATRSLALTSAEELAGCALVDALRRANEEMLAALDAAGAAEECPCDELAAAYAQFVKEWCGKEDVDAHLKLYLVGSLRAFIQRQNKKAPSAPLLIAHVHLLTSLAHLSSPPAAPSRIVSIARRYTSITPKDARVWLARLQAESVYGTVDSVTEAWNSARGAVPTCSEVWLWG
ncbi:U3 small nucleolar RNA-associated protein 6-domain-containing protein, partial [Russula brevipes]